MKTLSLSRVLAVVMALGLGAAITTYDAAPASAQQTQKTEKAAKTEKASKSQSTKKPAQSCEGMDKASKAYADCVKAQAQTTKDTQKTDQAIKKAEKSTKKETKKTTTKVQ